MSHARAILELMFDYLMDGEPSDTDATSPEDTRAAESPFDMYMTGYQKQRQRVYDRARHMVHSGNQARVEMEDAKLEAGLVRAEARVSRARGEQLEWVKASLRNHRASRLGYRNPVDYVASRVDVHRSTARDLVYLAERLGDGTIKEIRSGALSYVRVLEETRLREAGATAEVIERSRDMNLDRLRRLAQQHRKMTRDKERHVFENQYVAFQPSLDGSHVKLSGRLGAAEAEICRQGLDRRGETLVPATEDRPDPGLRRALALTTLCQDEVDRNPNAAEAASTGAPTPVRNRREPLLMVVAHQPLSGRSGYEQGAAVLAGGRVGPDIVDLVRCVGKIESVTVSGANVARHGGTTALPPMLRRAVLARDDGCTIDGCNSVYRLEVHHIIPQSQGGDHSPENLTTLCWWHHHVAVHRRGMRIDPLSPPQRRRLLPTPRSCGYHPPPPDPHTLAILRALHQDTDRAPPQP